jgi:hypothetical protein
VFSPVFERNSRWVEAFPFDHNAVLTCFVYSFRFLLFSSDSSFVYKTFPQALPLLPFLQYWALQYMYFFFWWHGVWTQGLMLARKALLSLEPLHQPQVLSLTGELTILIYFELHRSSAFP